VVNRYNFDEDMTDLVTELAPIRWKVFQVLMIKTENDGATDFMISDEEFQSFVNRHDSLKHVLVPEDNKTMTNSYLILDEKMRFLNCENGGKEPSESILDVGVVKALSQSGFDSSMFQKRGGEYDWTRSNSNACSTESNLDW